MDAFTREFAVVAAVLGAAFIGPLLAIGFLTLRKRHQRSRRRSPIGIDLLRAPGHSLREQIDEIQFDVQANVLALGLMPLLVLSLGLAQALLIGFQVVQVPLAIYTSFVVLFIAWIIRTLVKTGTKLDHLRAGYDAELAVGQELDQLMRQGAAVYHDVPGDNFNIDHVVIAPCGLFAIETKGYTKDATRKGRDSVRVAYDGKTLRFPSFTTSAPIEQADRQATWLRKWASSAVGEDVGHAIPVVALPGWFVETTADGPVSVRSGKQLAGLLHQRDPRRYSPAMVQRLAHQVEQRCRTVAPTYGRSDKTQRR